MLELQIKDQALFEQLKPHAEYYSNRTKVLTLPENKRNLIPSNYQIDVVNKNPELSYAKRKFFVNGIDEIAKLYLGMYNLAGVSCTFRSIDKLNQLLYCGIVVPDKQFENTFSKLTDDATINDLICSECGFRVNHKLHKYKDILDIKVQDLINNTNKINKEKYVYPFNVQDVYTEKDKRGKVRLVVAGSYRDDEGIKDLSAQLYGNITSFEKAFSTSKIINVLLNDKKKYLSFVPAKFTADSIRLLEPTKEFKKELQGLPILLYRIMMEEIYLRNNLLGKD